MKALIDCWRRFWFEEAPAQRLALVRIFTGLFTLWYLGGRVGMFSRVAQTEASLFTPVGLAAFLQQPLPPGVFDAILWLTLLANVACVAGLAYRFTGPLFGVLLLFTLCYRNSWSMLYHTDNIMAVHVLILGLAPAADALSIDALRRRAGSGESLSGWQYGWPLKLMCAAATVPYLLSGIAKWAGELGLSWASGSALRAQVAVDTLRKDVLGEPVAPLAFMLYEHVWLFTFIGILSLIVELGAPLALLNRRIGYFWVIQAILMHWGIFAIMHITFRYQMWGVMFLCFLPVEKAFTWAILKLPRPAFRQRMSHAAS